jgi:hypothetical protein
MGRLFELVVSGYWQHMRLGSRLHHLTRAPDRVSGHAKVERAAIAHLKQPRQGSSIGGSDGCHLPTEDGWSRSGSLRL